MRLFHLLIMFEIMIKISDQFFPNKQIMQTCCRHTKTLLRKCDLFATTEFLRYKGEPEYATVTGGLTSLAVITIFVTLFARMGLQTLNRNIINSETVVEYELNPSKIDLKVDPQNKFMIGINVVGLNLNDPNITYFDISVSQTYRKHYTQVVNSTSIPLQPCTAEQWNFEESFGDLFSNYGIGTWLCMPIGQQFTLQGRASSEYWGYMNLTVKKCNTSKHSNCVSDAQLAAMEQAFGQFVFGVGIITTVVNPAQKNYRTPVIDQRNGFYLSTQRAINGFLTIQEVEVNTDNSLLPTQDITSQTYYSIPQTLQVWMTDYADDTYGVINFRKSEIKIVHTRSFNKADEYFSYVGGLIGTILGLIFIMNIYSEKAYEVSIVTQLYLDQDGQKISSSGFHIGYMFMLVLSKVASLLGCKPGWTKTQKYERCMEKAEQRLDIANLLKKMSTYQRAFEFLLGGQKMKEMFVYQKLPLSQSASPPSSEQQPDIDANNGDFLPVFHHTEISEDQNPSQGALKDDYFSHKDNNNGTKNGHKERSTSINFLPTVGLKKTTNLIGIKSRKDINNISSEELADQQNIPFHLAQAVETRSRNRRKRQRARQNGHSGLYINEGRPESKLTIDHVQKEAKRKEQI